MLKTELKAWRLSSFRRWLKHTIWTGLFRLLIIFQTSDLKTSRCTPGGRRCLNVEFLEKPCGEINKDKGTRTGPTRDTALTSDWRQTLDLDFFCLFYEQDEAFSYSLNLMFQCISQKELWAMTGVQDPKKPSEKCKRHESSCSLDNILTTESFCWDARILSRKSSPQPWPPKMILPAATASALLSDYSFWPLSMLHQLKLHIYYHCRSTQRLKHFMIVISLVLVLRVTLKCQHPLLHLNGPFFRLLASC